MARPRKYVQIDGREITGVSKMPDGRFYIIDDGRRAYFRSADDARAAYLATQSRHLTTVERAELVAKAEIRRAAAHEKLKEMGLADQPADNLPSGPPVPLVVRNDDAVLFGYLETAHALADMLGIPQAEIRRVEHNDARKVPSPALSKLLAEWRHLKIAGRGGKETQHIRGASRVFRQFIKVVGDLPVCDLPATAFGAWREWVTSAAQKPRSGKWANDQHAIVKQIIRFVRRHHSEWPWPNGLTDWLEAYDRQAYQPAAENRQPLPPDGFRKLLDVARGWAETNASLFDPSTQRGRGQRRQANIRQHNGQQLLAILLLGANCGLDPVDIPRILLQNLKTDGAIPYLDLPRAKAKHRVGAAVDRKTPLLPSTVRALREVVAKAPPTGPVFRSTRGTPFKTVTQSFRILANEAGTDPKWSFKHLRNIGPTLAKRAKRSKDERDAFLGHVVSGTSVFYEGDLDENYLVDLVNLIGEHYFNGEEVQTREQGSSDSRTCR